MIGSSCAKSVAAFFLDVYTRCADLNGCFLDVNGTGRCGIADGGCDLRCSGCLRSDLSAAAYRCNRWAIAFKYCFFTVGRIGR